MTRLAIVVATLLVGSPAFGQVLFPEFPGTLITIPTDGVSYSVVASITPEGNVFINWGEVRKAAADPQSYAYLYAKILLCARNDTDCGETKP